MEFTRHERNVRQHILEHGNEISMVNREEVEDRFPRADIDGMIDRNILTTDRMEGRDYVGIQANEAIMVPLL